MKTTMRIEKDASNLYTIGLYYLVREEINKTKNGSTLLTFLWNKFWMNSNLNPGEQ